MHCKQMIVVRTDLGMPVGKVAAQVAHASSKMILDNIVVYFYYKLLGFLKIKSKSPIYHWVNGDFTKICVGVSSEKELMAIYDKAISKGLKTSLIVDSGRTIFNNIPTKTCFSIEPTTQDKLVGVTDKLRLL